MKLYRKLFCLLFFVFYNQIVFAALSFAPDSIELPFYNNLLSQTGLVKSESRMVTQSTLSNNVNTSCNTGTLLFREDFGGNLSTDPIFRSTPLPQVTGITFGADGNPKYKYAVRKFGFPHTTWYSFGALDDHTYPGDTTRGYFLQVDGTDNPAQIYSCRIDGLCANAEVYLSMWGMSTIFLDNSYYANANLKLLVRSVVDNSILASKNVELINGKGAWEQMGLSFVLPVGINSIIYCIENNSGTGMGNDFAIDDIEIRLCTPPVIIKSEQTICKGYQANFNGTFQNDGTFLEPLEYRWLYSSTGDLTSQKTWQVIGTNSNEFNIPSAQEIHSGYYRLAVASSGNIDITNCRAISDPTYMEVKQCVPQCIKRDTISHTICYGETYLFNSAFLDKTGTYFDTLYTNTGCDSIICLQLTAKPRIELNIDTTICEGETILFGTSLLAIGGDYTHIYETIKDGCDSIIHLHVSVIECIPPPIPSNDTIVASACDSAVTIKFLDNDTYTCAIPQVSLLTQPTVLGAVATIQHDSLVYTIYSGHAAIDSVQYSVICDGVAASAWVYIVVQSNSVITTEVFPNDTICKGEYLLFSGKLTNGGTLELPVMYQWQTSFNGLAWTAVDSLGWTAFGSGTGNATTMFPTSNVGTTYYRLVIAEGGDYFLHDCFVTSSVIPIYVVQPTVDTLRLSGCGQVEYENTTFVSDSTFMVETQSAGGCYNELTVKITVKPEPFGETTVTDCDSVTYLGITYFHDTDLTERFSSPSECDSLFVTHINVDNCLSGYLIENLIVNKYDWIVLCNNTKAKKLVSNYDEIHYQWYKDGQKMIGELDDYYTEDRLLFGCFFLRLLIMAEGQAYPFISETLCINHQNLTISPNPVTLSEYATINYDFTDDEKAGLYVQIYDYLGMKITQFEPASYPIYLPAGLAQGIYYVKVITGTNRIYGVKLIVN